MKIILLESGESGELENNGQLVSTIIFSAEVNDVVTWVHVPKDIITHRWTESSDVEKIAKMHRSEIESVIQDNANRNNFFSPSGQPRAYLYNGML